ncbi:MAG: DNRLRE domain-containing protein, partial [Verrucomicrobiales bacterium]
MFRPDDQDGLFRAVIRCCKTKFRRPRAAGRGVRMTRQCWIWIAVGLLSMVVSGGSARAGAQSPEVAVLVPVKDATLYENPQGSTANGSGAYLFAGLTNNGAARRGLIAFDIAGAIPEGSEITDAVLTLNLSRVAVGIEGGIPVHLERAARNWGEGASDAGEPGGAGTLAVTGDATWIHTFFDTEQWENPGGDRLEGVIASSMVLELGPYSWTGPDLVADVQALLDSPLENFGWFLMGDEITNGTASRFDSGEHPTEANRPQLTIPFIPP